MKEGVSRTGGGGGRKVLQIRHFKVRQEKVEGIPENLREKIL